MASITTRAGKGSPLTNAEIDANFTNLNTELGGKLSLAGGTMTGAITFAAGQTWPTFNQNTTGSAASLTTGRTIGMTGDVTWTSGSFNGTANVTGTATLSASGVTAGTYGSAVNIPQITVDAKGRLTDVSNVAVSIPSGSLTFTGDVTGTGSTGSSTTLTLANSGVTAGTYTKVTVDAKGRVTTGASLSSSDVTSALGYTPYNSTNPSGYITGINSSMVTTALGYTPYNSSNPSGYITAGSNITGTAAGLSNTTWARVTTAYGYIDFGPANTSYAHIYTDRPSFYFNAQLDVLGNRVLNAGNYTSYSPSLTGSGASGTWGINVTGSAGSVAWSNVSGRPTAVSSFSNDSGYITSSGSISGSAGSVSGLTLTSSANGINPDSVTQNQIGYNTSVSLFGQTDGGLYSSAYSSSWIHQIYGDFRTGQIAIRGKNSGTWQAWRTVLDSSNYTSYAATASHNHDGRYLRADVTNTMFSGQGSALAFENQTSFFRFAFNELRFYDWNNGQDILTLNGNISTPNTMYAYSYRGNGNVGGTGEATHHPAGIYSQGTNWLYGSMYLNGNTIYDCGRMNGPWTSGSRCYSNEWIEFGNYSGLYSPNNGAHFYPNDSSYGAWKVNGSRNGWRGLEFQDGLQLMMNYNAHGIHRSDTGWMMYIESRNLYMPGQIQAGWSDTRLKDNQQRVGRADVFGTLSQLRAHRFNWNAKAIELGYDVQVGDEEIGLIAQHVKAALPVAAAVNKAGAKPGDDGSFDYLTIRWDKITPFAVEAVNIHEEDITFLKAKVERLEALVATLIGD